jgi:hypothetical protein
LAHEYGWPLTYILNELPLAQAFALYAAIAARYEQPLPGPSYVEQDAIAALRAAS